jgi:hypothetical protein
MRRTLGKPYGINVRCCYWELLGELLGEPLGTRCEHTGNKEPKPPPPPTAFLFKKENWTPHECMTRFLIDCMKLLFPKLFVTIFGLG